MLRYALRCIKHFFVKYSDSLLKKILINQFEIHCLHLILMKNNLFKEYVYVKTLECLSKKLKRCMNHDTVQTCADAVLWSCAVRGCRFIICFLLL